MVFFMMFDFIYYSCFSIVNIVFWHIRLLYVQQITYLLTTEGHY